MDDKKFNFKRIYSFYFSAFTLVHNSIKKFLPNIDHHIVAVGSKVEQKNSHIQRNFHRLKNAKRGNTINAVLQQAVDITNNSYNRVLKKTPAEAVAEYTTPEGLKKIKEQYNSNRAKADTDRRKPLKVGDWVRVLIKKEKEGTFYKAYRGTTYTKRDFPVNDQNLKNFPDKALSKESYEIKATRGSNPKQYQIFGLFKNAKRGNTINAVLQQAVDITNNSYNRILKKTPAEAAAEYSTPDGIKKIKEQYNAKRAKADTDRRKALKIGDWVRVLIKKEKEGTFYKAYRGTTYTKKDFPVNKQNLKNYPNKALSQEAYEIKATRGSNPKQYQIFGLFKNAKKGKWFGRHELSEPLPNKGVPDQKSEALLKNRNQSGNSKNGKPKPKPKKGDPKPKPKKKKPVQKYFEYDNVTNARSKFHPFEKKLRSIFERGTITQQKYNTTLKKLEDFIEFFVWHSSHGLSMDKPEARSSRNKARKLLVTLKKIKIL